jgi:hypothetical protein
MGEVGSVHPTKPPYEILVPSKRTCVCPLRKSPHVAPSQRQRDFRVLR